MNPRRKQRLFVASVLVLGLAAATALILSSVDENMDYFYTPYEIVNGKNETGIKPKVGQRLRIGGVVVPDSVKRSDDSLDVSFQLETNEVKVTVNYTGLLPDLFREGQGIIAQGNLVNSNTIDAFEVLAKHDEEYMPPEIAEQMKGVKHEKPNYTKEQLGQ